MQIRLFVPRRLVLATHIFELGWDKLSLPKGSECVIDMSTCTYGEPQGIILFAVTCRNLIKRHPVISPFLTGCIRRIHAAIFNFMTGVMPPMPMLGRSLL